MNIWRLASPTNFTEPALTAHHIEWLCFLAFLVAVFASSVLLSVMQRYHQSAGRVRSWWLSAGSIVMGTGIWAMHFTGMLAFSLPAPVEYSWTITMISVIPAVLASASFLALYRLEQLSQRRMIAISLIMAMGIGTMHFIGMEAMIVAADMYYEPVLFISSILAAVVLAYCAVYAQSRLVTQRFFTEVQAKVVGSLTLGLAVTLMHFIAMNATYFQANDATVLGPHSNAPVTLIVQVLALAVILILFAAISSVVDRRMEEISSQLQNSEARFQSLAESTQTAIFTFTTEHITYANPALCEMTHLNLVELYNRPLEEVFDCDFKKEAEAILNGQYGADSVIHEEVVIRDSNNEEKWLFCSLTQQEIDNELVILASAFDITEQKITADKMQHLAYYDQLTKLHNRTVFMDRLQHYLESIQRKQPDAIACVMILDLDGFKSINDSLGHLQGDQLLITVADRLRSLARNSDTMSRFGGDEFVLLFEQVDNVYDIEKIADRILRTISQPVDLGDRKIEVSTSIGIVELNQDSNSPDEVLHDADVALYRAKELGSASWVMFDEHLDATAKRERELLPELKRAIEQNQLEMYFQPICRAQDGSVSGFEALARWTRDNGEFVSPGEFIPLAEEAGLIHDIGLWAVESAAIQIAQLNKFDATNEFYISINIDAGTLDNIHFHEKVVTASKQHGVKRGQIKIELTERGLIKDTEAIIPKMQSLIILGCEFMIDDFGTGYSSLSYLHKLPIQTLKIDRSFVLNLNESDSSDAVVRTIITLADSLGLTVVAEGVETNENVEQLAAMNCHQLQGFFFSKPMPAGEIEDFLANHQLRNSPVLQRFANSDNSIDQHPLN